MTVPFDAKSAETQRTQRTMRKPEAASASFLLCAFSVVALFASNIRADQRVGPEVDAAVEKGLGYLAKQQKADGSITDGPNGVATTALAVLGYLAAGHAPDAGKHGLVVRGAVDFLVQAVPKNGYVGSVDGSRMYGQGIVALALAEAMGVEPNPQKRDAIQTALQRLIDVILTAQKVQKDDNNRGGWRYEPGSGDSDLSLSGWSALALRASQNVGMNVSKEPVERAVQYVVKCFKADEGAFTYQPGQGPSIAMTSVAILDLHLLDAADRDEVKRAATWLGKQAINNETRFFYYSLYYSTQAATQVGGDLQEQIWKNNKKLLLAKQQDDGGFAQSPSGDEPGRVYATSMSVMTLAVPYETLPIYQK